MLGIFFLHFLPTYNWFKYSNYQTHTSITRLALYTVESQLMQLHDVMCKLTDLHWNLTSQI